MDKLKMTFSDCLAEIETIKISYTYLGCLEGHPSLLSKWILEREIEKKEGKNAYLLFDQKTCNDTLGNYRFEIDFTLDDYRNMKVVPDLFDFLILNSCWGSSLSFPIRFSVLRPGLSSRRRLKE